jgi:hypothetical protein
MISSLKAGAVLYANDITRVATFYANVIGFNVSHAEASHIILDSSTFQLVVHAIPTEIAATIGNRNATRSPGRYADQIEFSCCEYQRVSHCGGTTWRRVESEKSRVGVSGKADLRWARS